jgi:hypothetical protein
LFGPVLHVGRQRSTIARTIEHYRKHDDAHHNPEGQEYIYSDHQPPVYGHLFITPRSAECTKTPPRQRQCDVHPNMNAHPLNYTRHGVVTSELQYYRSMRKRTMIGACWLALIDEGKYESLGFSIWRLIGSTVLPEYPGVRHRQLRLFRHLSVVRSRGQPRQRGMKTKTWTVITNTGKHAGLESGLEKKAVQRPTHISAGEFIHWLAPQSHVDDDTLRSLFKL